MRIGTPYSSITARAPATDKRRGLVGLTGKEKWAERARRFFGDPARTTSSMSSAVFERFASSVEGLPSELRRNMLLMRELDGSTHGKGTRNMGESNFVDI